jgi:hypothetical protein
MSATTWRKEGLGRYGRDALTCVMSLYDLPAMMFSRMRYSKFVMRRRRHRSVQGLAAKTARGSREGAG